MKIKLILVLCLFMPFVALNAQRLGIRAGVNLNNSSVQFNNMDAKLRTGFNAGVISDFNLPLIGWKINTGLLYSYQAFSLKQDYGNNGGISYHFITNNLEVPVNIRKEFNLLVVKPFIQGGVYGSYVLSGKIKDGNDSQSMKFVKDGDKLDLGLNIGAGSTVIPNLRLLANYGFGFNKRQVILGDQTLSYKNACWSISAEYMF